jgi:ribose-phosphate pyrophosphokinase
MLWAARKSGNFLEAVGGTMDRPLKVFTGKSNPDLANAICKELGIPLGQSETQRFSNDNLQVKFKESLREGDIFIVQSLSANGEFNVSDSIMELLLMIDAAKTSSAARVTAVIPYFSYARSDKKDEARIPIAARVVADMLQTAGADRVLTMTLHSPQVHGFFKIPVDHLTAEVVLANYFATHLNSLEDTVVLAPDAGDIKRASSFAGRLDTGLAFIDKRRVSDTKVESRGLIGDVKGKTVLIVDDEVSTAGTLVEAVDVIKNAGAKAVYVAVSHGVYAGPAVERIKNLDIVEMIATDTVLIGPEKTSQTDKLKVVTVAPIFAEAIHRIHTGESISSMFK